MSETKYQVTKRSRPSGSCDCHGCEETGSWYAENPVTQNVLVLCDSHVRAYEGMSAYGFDSDEDETEEDDS